MYDIYLEGFIKDDKFIVQSVSYCSVHEEEREKRKGINGLKVQVYHNSLDDSISYEKEVYLSSDGQQEPDKQRVIFHVSDISLQEQVIKVIELNEQGEVIKILAEIIRKDIPKQDDKPYPRSYSCKKQAFHFPPEQTSQTK